MTKLGKIKHHIYNRYLIYSLKKSKVLGCTRYALGTNHQLFSPLNVDHFYPRFFSHFCTVLIIFIILFARNTLAYIHYIIRFLVSLQKMINIANVAPFIYHNKIEITKI